MKIIFLDGATQPVSNPTTARKSLAIPPRSEFPSLEAGASISVPLN